MSAIKGVGAREATQHPTVPLTENDLAPECP